MATSELALIVCVFLSLQFMECTLTHKDCLNVGVIANGANSEAIKKISKFDHNISLHWHKTNTSEMYNIYRIVRKLDANSEIDAIILFDYDPYSIRKSNLAQSTNKTLIQWGQEIHLNSQLDDQKLDSIDSRSICGVDSTDETKTRCSQGNNSTTDQERNRIFTLHGSKTIGALVKILNWKQVFIFYETATEEEMSDLVDKLSQEGVLISLFNINNVPDLKALFQRIYDTSIYRNRDIKSIVICRYNGAREILTTANTFDADNHGYKTQLRAFSSWLVVVYGQCYDYARCLKEYASELDNIAVVGFPEIYTNGSKKLLRLLDSVLLDILKETVQGHGISFKKSVIERLATMSVGWSPTTRCLVFSINTLMYTTSGRKFSSVGRISIYGNVSVHSEIFPNTKFGYNSKHFNVSTLEYEPFVTKNVTNGSVVYMGFCFDLLRELSKKLNFTYSVVEPFDGLWGSSPNDTNLKFNGLIGQLQRGEVDMVVAPITTTYERLQVMDFSSPFFYDYSNVLVKKPDVNARKWRTLIDPFKWEVLVAIGISLPLVTVLAFLLEKYNPFYKKMKHAEERAYTGGIHTLQSSVWYMYGALLCQGGVHLPDSVAGRTLVSAWWLFCIVIVGIYSGNLIAFLTVTKEKPPFNTLEEMTRQKSTYKWGLVSGTSHEMTFLHSNNPTYKAIGDGLREFNRSDPGVLHTNVEEHIRKVKQGNYAWIGDNTYIEIQTSKECNLMSIKQKFLPMKYALGFTKHSPHTAIFSEQVMKLFEGGLFQIWKRKWWPKDNFCEGDTLTGAKPISLLDVQSAFYVCCVGIFFGLLAFISELIVHKCKTKHLPKEMGNSCNNSIHVKTL